MHHKNVFMASAERMTEDVSYLPKKRSSARWVIVAMEGQSRVIYINSQLETSEKVVNYDHHKHQNTRPLNNICPKRAQPESSVSRADNLSDRRLTFLPSFVGPPPFFYTLTFFLNEILFFGYPDQIKSLHNSFLSYPLLILTLTGKQSFKKWGWVQREMDFCPLWNWNEYNKIKYFCLRSINFETSWNFHCYLNKRNICNASVKFEIWFPWNLVTDMNRSA